jgi:hypothetical protein
MCKEIVIEAVILEESFWEDHLKTQTNWGDMKELSSRDNSKYKAGRDLEDWEAAGRPV